MADDERVPEPGHFLPSGAESDATGTAGEMTPLTPADTGNRRPQGLGEARPVSISHDPVRKKAAPLPDDPEYQGFYSGPPAAPRPGAPTGALQGTRQFGRVRYDGWKTTSPRTGVQQFATHSAYRKPVRQFSQRFVGLISALALVIVAGGTIAAYAKIDSFGNEVTNPLADPSVKPSEGPQSVAPNPTVTVTIPPVPDLVRLQKNELYQVGKVPTVKCAVPKVKPDTKANVLRFYQALLPCLHETWEPLVLKANYPFRQPKLVLAGKTSATPCTGESTNSFYCGVDETITIKWEQDLKDYKAHPEVVVVMMDTLAHEYGHHVQRLTEMVAAVASRRGFAKTKAENLEWSRREELQATCLGAAFLGANKNTLGLTGQRLDLWERLKKNSGDEYNPKKVRDHGSKKSQWLWAGPAFKTMNPASCNTFTAPSAKVS
ncbi:neutral zinc metallopeptidase [Kribbella sp. NBC_00382]|uniref:neutral zinc metallopeptidase n=1 Tax=Kribbella sp. NBC_00382 TaxID=2975967 RepID=UPI002E1A7B27